MNMLKKEKDDIRKKYINKRNSLDPEKKSKRDIKICKSALAGYRFADCVLMYAPTGSEPDIMPIAEDALKKGKKVAFPRCDTEKHTMKYHFITSVDELEPDAYGIREPSASLPIYDPESHMSAICLVPALVYDRRGCRLGYGKGFYDRYLSSFKGNVIGIIYSDFILPKVPRGRFDIKINVLLTEKGVTVTSEN